MAQFHWPVIGSFGEGSRSCWLQIMMATTSTIQDITLKGNTCTTALVVDFTLFGKIHSPLSGKQLNQLVVNRSINLGN